MTGRARSRPAGDAGGTNRAGGNDRAGGNGRTTGGLGSPLRLAGFSGALVVLAVGISLMIRADLGVAPYDVLVTGIARTIGRSIGTTAMLVPLAFIAAAVLLGGRPGAGTVLATLAVGPVIDVVLPRLPDVDPLALRIPCFLAGLGLVTAGIAGTIAARVGAGPIELLMLAVHDRGIPLPRVRTAIETGCVLVGWLLGGQVGPGTLVFALAVGPLLTAGLDVLARAGGPGAPVRRP